MLDRQSSLIRAAELPSRARRRTDDERRVSGTVIAAVVAGGLALSASLYPPAESPIGTSDRSKTLSVNRIAGLDVFDLPMMLQVAEILTPSASTVSVAASLTPAGTYGLRNILEYVEGGDGDDREIYSSAGILSESNWAGAGGGGSPQPDRTSTLAESVLLANLLRYYVPAQFGDSASGVLRRMLPEFLAPPDVQFVMSSLIAVAAVPQPVQPTAPEVGAVLTTAPPTEPAVPPTTVDTPIPATPTEAPVAPPDASPPVIVITETPSPPTSYVIPRPIETPASTVVEAPSAAVPATETDDPPSTTIEPPQTEDVDDQTDSGEPAVDDESDAGAEDQQGSGEGLGAAPESGTNDPTPDNEDTPPSDSSTGE